jgi:hypothetical protein
VDHLFTFRIIPNGFRNTKTNIFCCFVDFIKAFDMVPRKNLWNRLEEIKVPLNLRVTAIRMYENVIAKFKNTEGWSKEIKYWKLVTSNSSMIRILDPIIQR